MWFDYGLSIRTIRMKSDTDTNTDTNNEKSLKRKIKDSLKRHYIQKGKGKGLVRSQDVKDTIVSTISDVLIGEIKRADDLTDLSAYDGFHTVYSEVIDALHNKIWSGEFVPVRDEDGNITSKPKTTSPRIGMRDEDYICGKVEKDLLLRYVPKTPTLKHNPDAIRFLEICKALFPNVINAYRAANGFRDFIEDIHNACGTEGAEFDQMVFWL